MALESLENQSGDQQNTGSTTPGFDADWYLQQNPDVAASPFATNPYAHYTQYGQGEGRLGMAPQGVPESFGTVESLYQNVLNRPGEQAGIDYWKSQFGDTIDRGEYDQFMAAAKAELAARDTNTGTGVATNQQMTASGVPYTNIASAINQTLADPNVSAIDKANKIYDVSQQYNVTQDDIAKALNIPVAQVQGYFQNRTDFPIQQAYDKYLGRTAEEDGLKYWRERIAQGATADQIAAEIARSPESIGRQRPTLTTELSTEFANKFDSAFLDNISKDKMTQLVDAYGAALVGGDKDTALKNIYTQIAQDSELGAKLKQSDPFLYESLTPLTKTDGFTTSRGSQGYYGTHNGVPILNASVAANLVRPGETLQDFSHSFGDLARDLGISTNSASNSLARGAAAIGVTKTTSDVYGNQYQGLDEAARALNIDPGKFQFKEIQAVSKPGFDEAGNYNPGGEPLFEIDSMGNRVPVMTYVTAEDQLYDAVNEASKDIYRFTYDTLEPGKAVEGGAQNMQTTMFKAEGDKLLAITNPVSSGGMQNAAVYRPKDYGFGYYAQGPAFVAAGALSFAMADPSLSLATAVGSALMPAAASAALGATGTGIVGSVALGAAAGALSSTAAGGNIEKGVLTGAVSGLVASGMRPLMATDAVKSATQSISSMTGGAFSPTQVGNIIGSTLSSTLSSAASGANGQQILDAFKVSLISSGLTEKSAELAVAGVKEAFGNDPKMLARTAAATRLITRTASTAALSGANPQQIQSAVITTLIQNAGDVVGAGSQRTPTTKKAEADELTPGQREILLASGSTATDVLPTSTEEAIRMLSNGNVQQAFTSPYAMDAEGNVLYDESGNPRPNPFIGGAVSTGTTTGGNVSATQPMGPISEAEIEQFKREGVPQAEIDQLTQRFGLASQKDAEFFQGLQIAFQLATGRQSTPVKLVPTTNGGMATLYSSGAIVVTDSKNKVTSVTKAADTTGPTGATGGTSGTGVTGSTGPTGATGTTVGEGGGAGTGGEGPGGTGTGGGGTGTGTGGGGTGGTGGGGTGTGGGGSGGPRVPKLPTIPQITAARRVAADDMDGIYNLTPGMTKARTDYQLAGQFKMADGGSVSQYNPFGLRDTSMDSGIYDAAKSPFIGSDIKMPRLTVGLTKRMLDYALPGLFKMAEGGSVPGGHNPEFFSEGGLNSLENTYVNGEGDGTSDSVPAMLANGEFVIPADVVSSLGNGSNEAGANVLDEFLQVIREHKQKHDAKELPPDSKGALAYLLDAKKRA